MVGETLLVYLLANIVFSVSDLNDHGASKDDSQ